MPQLTETARAKVNLTLRVLGRRVDGYHDLESIVAFADCADRLTLEPGAELKLTTTGPGAAECGDATDNLVVRAARSLAEKVAGLSLGHFILDKHLPVAAGVGGGSADAAAALRLLAHANDLDPADARLAEVARVTGADIPVCLASTACNMSGIGETIKPLTLPALPCVLVNPRAQVATKDVFAGLGLKNGELLVGATEVIRAGGWPGKTASFDKWVEFLSHGGNDLEAPALRVQPVIGDVLSTISETKGNRLARMSGSGATCFGIFADGPEARSAATAIAQSRPEWWVHAGTLS